MNLNTIKPARGAKTVRKRLGRGIGSGLGKTAGKGHKGQKARKGVSIFGFEGGQTPLQRRLPKSGFISQKARHVDNIRLFELAKVADDSVTLASLRAAGLINRAIKEVKIILFRLFQIVFIFIFVYIFYIILELVLFRQSIVT